MKRCSQCHQPKQLSCFTTHKRASDGLASACRDCVNARRRLFRVLYPEVAHARDAKEHEARKLRPAIVARRNAELIAWQKAHPKQHRANRAVRDAVYRGKLTRLPCQECGATPAEAHHPDYSKPLSVLWLCRKHHDQWHKTNGPGLNHD